MAAKKHESAYQNLVSEPGLGAVEHSVTINRDTGPGSVFGLGSHAALHLFEKAYTDYLGVLASIDADVKQRYFDAWNNYQERLSSIHTRTRERWQTAQRSYLRAISEAWGSDDFQDRAQEAERLFSEHIKNIWTPSDEAECFEALVAYQEWLHNESHDNSSHQRLNSAYQDYLSTIARISDDFSSLSPEGLATIGHSMIEIAFLQTRRSNLVR